MNENDWLPVPNLVCRQCGSELHVNATEKRPVSEFYVLHPKGLCPLSDDWFRIDSKGNVIEDISHGSDWK
jgi:hypothetical protein